MPTSSTSAFEIVSWDQRAYDEQDTGPKLARADVKRIFRGDVEAESLAVLLLCQADDGSAGYVASERVVGRIRGRSGTFVIQHGGTMSGDKFTSFGYVVPGSGTGELQGLRGDCKWIHTADEATFSLDYDIG